MADHLEELLKDTPMSRLKLLAAWESLSAETQIKLLREISEISGRGRTEWGYSRRVKDRPIWLKALSSPSEYVRYLAARELRFDDEFESKVMADASPLVRSSRAIELDWPGNENFSRYPKEHKLAIVSGDFPPQAKKLANWVEHAAETKSVSDDEVCDVVLEYLCNPDALRRLHEGSYDFFGDSESSEGFKALWGLIPKVSSLVADFLVSRLPWRGVLEYEPPPEVLTWLETSSYLESLLRREDAPLLALRRKIFFSTDPKYDGVRAEAVWNNFYLGHSELHDLFKQNSKQLSTLAMFSRSLSPVMFLALKDSVWKHGGPVGPSDRRFCEEHFESSLAKFRAEGSFFSPFSNDKEIRFLRVYRLAKSVMDWNGTEPNLQALPEPLKYLGDKVVKGDTWGTFCAFADETSDGRFDHLLPRLEDLNLDAAEPKSFDASGKHPDVSTPARPGQGRNTINNAVVGLGIVAALLTILFAVGGILDNEYRNFSSGVVAIAISAAAIIFAGSQLSRNSSK